MTALASKRALRLVRASNLELAAAPSATYFQGAVVGFNTATGLVTRAGPLTTFLPIGTVADDKVLGAGSGTILVNLFRELHAIWMKNDAMDAVLAADVGNLCYILDDQTVKRDDDTNTLSVAGRVWKIDPGRGEVLVEPRQTAGDRLGGLDA